MGIIGDSNLLVLLYFLLVGGELKKYIFLLLFLLGFVFSCEDQIVSECDVVENNPGINTTFSSIQTDVFSIDCATSGCHETNSIDPDLSAGQAYNNIVNVMSFNPPFKYIVPFKSDSSYIINKLRGVNIQGERMPLNRQPLSSAVIDSIAAWIDRGALNN